MYWTLAYVTGGIIILLALFNFIFPSRKISLIFKASIDFVTIFNLLFAMLATDDMGILAGIVATVIGFCRDILFMFRDKSKILDNYAWPILFCIIFGCSLIFTYKSPLSLLPVIGSLFSTMTLYSRNQKVTKIGALTCLTLYIAYYAVLIPTSSVLTVFSLISSITGFVGASIGLIVIFKKEHDEKKLAVEIDETKENQTDNNESV